MIARRYDYRQKYVAPAKKLQVTEGPTPTDREYEISRMAEVVAEATSGVRDAVPEQDDYDPWNDPGLAFTNEEFSNFDYGLAATDGRIFYLP